jgi:hypothetical protein
LAYDKSPVALAKLAAPSTVHWTVESRASTTLVRVLAYDKSPVALAC